MLSWWRQGLKVRMVKDKRRKQGRKKKRKEGGAKQRKVHQQIYSFAVFVSLSLSVLAFSIECTWKMRVRVCNNAIPPKSQRQTLKDPGDPGHPRQPRAKDLRPSIPMTTKCPPWPWEEGGPGRSSNSQGKGCQETRGSGQLTLLEASHPRSLRTARNPAEPPPHDEEA